MGKLRLSTEFPTPHVYIDRDSFDDMLCISRATTREVAWFAQVHHEGNEVYVIDNVFLPKQQSSMATVEIEPEHLAAFADEYIQLHGPEMYNKLHCWGHSHHTMGVTPSGQDQKTVDELCAAIKQVFIAIRVNHSGQFQVDVAYPNGVTIEDANAYIGWIPREKEEGWSALVKERVEMITYKKALPPGKAVGVPSPGAYGFTDARYSWDDDGGGIPTGPLSEDEQRALQTEAITRIPRFPYEGALPYLKRVERLEALEMWEDADD
jgi:hypothetical protein